MNVLINCDAENQFNQSFSLHRLSSILHYHEPSYPNSEVHQRVHLVRSTHISPNRSSFAPRPEHVCQLCTWAGPSKTGFAYSQSPPEKPAIWWALVELCHVPVSFFFVRSGTSSIEIVKKKKWDDAKWRDVVNVLRDFVFFSETAWGSGGGVRLDT